MSYTKLFSSIVTSTIWTEDNTTRIVWITMLAMTDADGVVEASIPGLARIAAVPVDACRTAIAKLLAPDPDSRWQDHEGRHIEEIDGGWRFFHHDQFIGYEDARKLRSEISRHRVELIEILIDRDGPGCQRCREDTSYHIDHRRPLSRGGSNHQDNLQLLCPACNLQKGASLQ